LQVFVRDNNVDQALRVLKKKMQREGVFREMKRRRFYEKPSEKSAREEAEGIRRARKAARKKAQWEGLVAAPKKRRRCPAGLHGHDLEPRADPCVCRDLGKPIASNDAELVPSKIVGAQFVRTFATALVKLAGGRVYQIAMRVERLEQSSLIGPQVGLNSFQAFFIHEK
jgi:small subunit ribosomal protein S21